MNPLIWRIIIIILAVAFVPMIVAGTASLIASGIQGVTVAVGNLFKPFSLTGQARLEGLIRLCLYLVIITIIFRVLLGNGGDDK